MNLTEEEAATYDRQIRLWGLDAQKRLRAARICVVGIYGLGSEVCKNLVLAGIKSLCVVDHRTVAADCIGAQFLVQGDVGKNVAEAAATRLQILNPNVQIQTETRHAEELEDEFFREFDVVCLLGLASKTPFLERIDTLCREASIKFYCGEVFGFHGFFFADLGNEYNYVVEEVKGKGKVSVDEDPVESAEEPKAKKSTTDEDNQADDSVKMIKQCTSFASWKQGICPAWSRKASARSIRRSSPIFFVMLILQKFVDKHGRGPSSLSQKDDVCELCSLRSATLKELEVDEAVVPDDLLRQCVAELSPVCAVVGGVLAQEVIKAVSGKDTPLNNFFFYHGVQGNGMVEKLGYN